MFSLQNDNLCPFRVTALTNSSTQPDILQIITALVFTNYETQKKYFTVQVHLPSCRKIWLNKTCQIFKTHQQENCYRPFCALTSKQLVETLSKTYSLPLDSALLLVDDKNAISGPKTSFLLKEEGITTSGITRS